MGKLIVSAVPITLVEIIWPKCVPHLQKVVNEAPNDLTIDGLKKSLLEGNSMLLVVADGAKVVAASTIFHETYDTGHKALIISTIGGDRLSDWTDRYIEIVNALAIDFNCDEIRGLACRDGWLRTLKKRGWYKVHEVVGMKVINNLKEDK